MLIILNTSTDPILIILNTLTGPILTLLSDRKMGWDGLQVPAYSSYPLAAPPTSPRIAGRRKNGTAFEVTVNLVA
jgi:hypothetical protein